MTALAHCWAVLAALDWHDRLCLGIGALAIALLIGCDIADRYQTRP